LIDRPQIPDLQHHEWPVVGEHVEPDLAVRRLLAKAAAFHEIEVDSDDAESSQLLHDALAYVYAYWFGYRDGACFLAPDAAFEQRLCSAKVALEGALFRSWLAVEPVPRNLSREDCAAYLHSWVRYNPGVRHPLFDYIAQDATRDELEEFLFSEVTHNDVRDDELALLLVGLQGALKATVAASLWDECGNGQLERFRSYALRRLLHARERRQRLRRYRSSGQPWFARITSNTFKCLVTRPALRYAAYGSLLNDQSWARPHCLSILQGLKRVGLATEDTGAYFTARIEGDPRRADELLEAIRMQVPELSSLVLDQIVYGAHLSVAAGLAQYQRMLEYLSGRSG
jgi:hypothetical protein